MSSFPVNFQQSIISILLLYILGNELEALSPDGMLTNFSFNIYFCINAVELETRFAKR